ncbi:MAG: DNA replication/repair protein RecF [Actinomycetota bacterium]|nr:DNA replication/repair protein RecF [Actinomycetota bacterium]
MRVSAVTVRDFRNYERAELSPGDGLTVLVGPNGAGKTNLLEALYFGCTGRSSRTSNERELIRHGRDVSRVTVTTVDDEGTTHLLEVGFSPGEPKTLRVDGATVDDLSRSRARPLVSVFLPERLELVKGPPGARRAHLDQLVAALWPARADTRSAFSRALAQRNGLLARVRAGLASSASLASWDAELARHGFRLMADRGEALELLAPLFASRAAELGLPEAARLRYRPRSRAQSAEGLAAELGERQAADLERGFTAHGPHRDDLQLVHGETALRSYGSQGQQRVALLALLFAERDLLAAERGQSPLMLLDDVMSELDDRRSGLLSDLLRADGQALVATTDLDHVPGARGPDVRVVEVSGGAVRATGPREVPA